MNPKLSSQQFIGTPAPWHWDGDDLWHRGKGYDHETDPHQYTGIKSDMRLHTKSLDANRLLVETAPDLLAFAQWAESRQPEMLKMIEANKFVFTDIGNEPGNWQHLAFTLYTELCALNEMARPVIAKATKGES